jgi:uncharacterized protein (TIGR02246 family)
MIITWVIAALLQIAPRAVPSPAPVPADARAAIARANDDWLGAMQRQDAKALVEPYAEDGVFVLATGRAVTGRTAIEQLMRERFRTGGRIVGGKLRQDDLVTAGSMIYEWGHAELEVASPSGQAPTQPIGRYLTVWKADGAGNWRIIRNLSFGD